MNIVKNIINDIKNGNIKPIYFLMSEEEVYYIDVISDFIEKNVLKEEEKGFDQVVLYGRDVSIEDIISSAKKYPMIASKQVLIVKEAQDLSRTIDKLESYAENPQLTTILVLNYKYKKLDKRKKLYKTIAKNGLIYEGKKLYENQVPDWISKVLAEKKYKIEPKASQMLVEFLGTDLSKIANELNKLTSILPENTIINAEHIEENIGISKDFNVFELRKAIGQKDIVKANRIINYFAQNEKDNPIIRIISSLNDFFIKLLQYHGLHDKSKESIVKTLVVHSYFVGEYIDASRNYPMKKVSQIIIFLRDADVKSKGVGMNKNDNTYKDILKELLFKILH